MAQRLYYSPYTTSYYTHWAASRSEAVGRKGAVAGIYLDTSPTHPQKHIRPSLPAMAQPCPNLMLDQHYHLHWTSNEWPMVRRGLAQHEIDNRRAIGGGAGRALPNTAHAPPIRLSSPPPPPPPSPPHTHIHDCGSCRCHTWRPQATLMQSLRAARLQLVAQTLGRAQLPGRHKK